ncbi:hypothetical protein EV356DRAFT_501269 [Viridothelium virens]|uniref:DUF1275 domain protein n=1 Tax=Viridothelium virens TaxID=1048519 RepID=A0A6A6HA67_VIRVR|nr:hypothetical protein EV356DRAFT_501269 [Viridothelium virens]
MALPPPAYIPKDPGQDRSPIRSQIILIETSPTISQAHEKPLPKTPNRLRTYVPRLPERLRAHLLSPIHTTLYTELELLLLSFFIGMQDATTYPDYHCFASNQTGNTIFLALSALHPGTVKTLFTPPNVSTALGLFLLGGWSTGQLGHRLPASPRTRAWVLATSALQTALVLAAAALQFRVLPTRSEEKEEVALTAGTGAGAGPALGVLALLAFASGSQVVLSRSLKVPEISTAMATAAWVDLIIDPQLFGRGENRPRNRRLWFLGTLLAGGFAGAGVYRYLGSSWSILISGIGKLIVTIMFLFNESEDKGLDDENV